VIDNYIYDQAAALSMDENEVSEKIVLLKIDQDSKAALGAFPYDRSIYARVIENLNQAGVKVIGLDLDLTDKSQKPEEDLKLVETLKKYPNVIVPSIGTLAWYTDGKYPQFDQLDPPLKDFEVDIETAHINRVTDSDGVIRKSSLVMLDKDSTPIYSFAYQLATKYGLDVSKYLNLNEHSQIYIHYEGREKDFLNFPIYQVLDQDIFPEIKEYFKDKIVVIGYTMYDPDDELATPFSGNVKGIFVHLNIVNQFIDDRVVQQDDFFDVN
jgi:adenylate cyclase